MPIIFKALPLLLQPLRVASHPRCTFSHERSAHTHQGNRTLQHAIEEARLVKVRDAEYHEGSLGDARVAAVAPAILPEGENLRLVGATATSHLQR